MSNEKPRAAKKQFQINLGVAEQASVDDFLTKGIDPATKALTAQGTAVHPKDLDPWILKGVRLRRSQMRILQAEADKRQERDTGRGNTSVLIRDIVEAEIQKIMLSRR